MDIRKEFKTDLDREVSGEWLKLGIEAKILVARLFNEKHKKVMEELTKPYKTANRRQQLPDDVAESVLKDSMAEAIILDWVGLEEDGEPVPFSKDKAREYLDIKDFADAVTAFAQDMANYREAEIEDAEGN